MGLISTNWGGTYIQPWSSPDALAQCVTTNDYYPDNRNQPSLLWNAMIYPLLNMRVKGAVWYQGESNAKDPEGYSCMFPAMINDWREKFKLRLPFFFVQLAAFPDGQGIFPAFRYSQTAALNLSDVGMAVAIDLGDPGSPYGAIHPRNKSEVGRRLALQAQRIVYKKNCLLYTSPSPRD